MTTIKKEVILHGLLEMCIVAVETVQANKSLPNI